MNGSIKVGKNTKVDGDIDSVNGSISCYEGVVVDDNIATVNGSFKLSGTEVKGGLTTVNGRITLRDGSKIQRDIIIKKSKGGFLHNFFGSKKKKLEITLKGKSVVEGDIINKDDERPVILFLEKGSAVKGKVINVKIEKI